VTVHIKESENGRLVSDFERKHIADTRLAGASVTKTATLSGVLRATVSRVMSAHTNNGKTTSVKRKSGRKSTLTEGVRRILRRMFPKITGLL
jgi:IS30 family transposase